MKAYVAVTDNEWFDFLSRQPGIDEVNFWTPSGKGSFKALSPGQPLLFKLHHPLHFIAGGGFFTKYSVLPVSLAWDAFGVKNGAASYAQMRERIEKYRRIASNLREDYHVGCIVLTEPFFLTRTHWIPAPDDFHPNIVRGKGYDLSEANGRALWDAVLGARALTEHRGSEAPPSMPGSIYGPDALIRQRLGQGAFRVMVTDAYHRRCAVTGAKALPTLEAAHIRPVSEGGAHRLDNGLLLRSDVHALFDRGYVTVTPDFRFRASGRLRDDFDNGEEYHRISGERIVVPDHDLERPAAEVLEWHSDTVFLG